MDKRKSYFEWIGVDPADIPSENEVIFHPLKETQREREEVVSRIKSNRAYYTQLTYENPEAQSDVLALCKQDIVFWVNHFAWCFEPRENKEFPMVLFDFQAWGLRVWEDHLTHNKGDFLIEKSRDMGITWTLLYLLLWFWLFRPSSNFLIGSYREQEVDKIGNMATIFPKLRFVVDKLPDWMKPQGYNPKNHATYLRLFNPENQSLIVGSAPVPNFGRGGRFLAVVYDEHPQWEYGQAAWDSASQSTRNRISNGTPWGKDNCYATLALAEDNERMIYPGAVG